MGYEELRKEVWGMENRTWGMENGYWGIENRE